MSYAYESSTATEEKKVIIPCNISRKNLDLIVNIFLEESKLDVFGFHKEKNQYWGKKLKNNFFFVLTIQEKQIILYPLIDENNLFQSFYNSFTYMLSIYEDIPDF